MANRTIFEAVIQEARGIRSNATAYGDRFYAAAMASLVMSIQDAVDNYEMGLEQEIEVYRAAIGGILDLPWPGADVHNRYLHFVLDNRRIPTDEEARSVISSDHQRDFGHPFMQAEGLTPGQCVDCLEDPEGTQYGMPQP